MVFYVVIFYGKVEVVDLFLGRGVDFNVRGGRYGMLL